MGVVEWLDHIPLPVFWRQPPGRKGQAVKPEQPSASEGWLKGLVREQIHELIHPKCLGWKPSTILTLFREMA